MKKFTLLFSFICYTLFTCAQVTFNYTGSIQFYVVPAGIDSVAVDVAGAEGGSGPVGCGTFTFKPGGKGGRVQATIPVTAGDTLFILVGGKGENDNLNSALGGYNGGGNSAPEPQYTYYGGGGGGGASDIRLNGILLSDRVVVAGGGGGAGADGCNCNDLYGGDGGGLIGEAGEAGLVCICNPSGQGGTQTAGGAKGDWGCNCDAQDGSLGQGGNSNTTSCGGPTGAGGGGGGYYGGGGGGLGGGGGGSSYTTASANNVIHTQGYQAGDGIVTITPLQGGIAFGSTTTELCEKFCADYFDLSINNPNTWQWSFPGGVPSSSTLQNPTDICYNNAGDFDVTLITTHANGSDTLTVLGYMHVHPTPPIPVITQVGLTLTSTPSDFYQWQLNTVDIPGATNQSYTVTQSGFYTVIISDLFGCVNSSSIDVVITGIKEVYNEMQISTYPNPSDGNFTVELLTESFSGTIFTEVVNAMGQKIFASSATVLANHKEEISLGNIATGVYFLILRTEDGFVREKILVLE